MHPFHHFMYSNLKYSDYNPVYSIVFISGLETSILGISWHSVNELVTLVAYSVEVRLLCFSSG